jgi:hypothetical protein
MTRFKQINNITGWAVCAIAATVYVNTVEPTASLWDCGEFIASAYKLQIGHPPGAPFFLLLGRMFSFLAGNDVSQIAYWINILSALSSALQCCSCSGPLPCWQKNSFLQPAPSHCLKQWVL